MPIFQGVYCSTTRENPVVCVCVCVCVCLCMCVCLREIIVCGCAMLNHKRTHRKQQVPSNQSYLICIKRTHRHERYQHTSQPLSTPSSLSISICINSFDIPHARLVVFELLVALEALVTSNTVEHSRLLFFLLFTFSCVLFIAIIKSTAEPTSGE